MKCVITIFFGGRNRCELSHGIRGNSVGKWFVLSQGSCEHRWLRNCSFSHLYMYRSVTPVAINIKWSPLCHCLRLELCLDLICCVIIEGLLVDDGCSCEAFMRLDLFVSKIVCTSGCKILVYSNMKSIQIDKNNTQLWFLTQSSSFQRLVNEPLTKKFHSSTNTLHLLYNRQLPHINKSTSSSRDH